MGRLGRGIARIGGARVIVAIGFLYVALAIGRTVLVAGPDEQLPDQLLNLLLVSLLSLVLVYSGYRLPATDIHPDAYPRVAGWTLLGGLAMILVILVVAFTPGTGIRHLRLAVLLFGTLGSIAGFGIGFQEATAITRAREAEQQRWEVERYSCELERQNRRLDSYAGMLAHELGNPLTIAQIYLQQAQPRNEDAAEEVSKALDRIEEMIDILLVTVRGSNANIDWESVDLSDVAADAWADLSPEAATLVVETDQTIRADSIHIRHLLKNLFKNAIEHGGADTTVRVGALEAADGFYVADDGPGISPEVRDDVVEAGYSTKSNGIGLGLTFISNLVDVYGWDWMIAESPAGGAQFEFADVDLVAVEEPKRR